MKRCQAALRAAVMMAACAGMGAPLARAHEDVDTYGTATTSNYVVHAFAFDPFVGAGSNITANNFRSRGCSGAPCGSFWAPVMLPAGAVIVAMELEACDTDPAGDVSMDLVRFTQLEGGISNLANVFTSGTPGCAFFNVNLVTPHTVNNETTTYQLRAQFSGNTIATRFQAVRISYRLQVSAAPATATFPNDVPTSHPFFRFIEALAAAGITGGCSAGSYCPNSPVTRGEMAVFLATSLGLHFPN